MNDIAKDLEQFGQDILDVEVSDEALEAAAGTTTGAAMSLGAPTVSVLILCCGQD